MSDDIPIIFAEDIAGGCRRRPAAVFLSAASGSQMQQYAAGGWHVLAAQGFRCKADVDLAKVPATVCSEDDAVGCALLSCEIAYLGADAGARIAKLKPEIIKFNLAFSDVADAGSLASSMQGMGYTIIGAHWRDDNSFAIRSLAAMDKIEAFPAPEWDRMNLIGVREAARIPVLLSVARLYVGEERRIAELRLANAIRNDHIARLEEALSAQQASAIRSREA
jgi:hypothetical protein